MTISYPSGGARVEVDGNGVSSTVVDTDLENKATLSIGAVSQLAEGGFSGFKLVRNPCKHCLGFARQWAL